MSEPIFSERPPEEPKPGPFRGPFRPKPGPFRGPFRPKKDRKPYIEPKKDPEEPKKDPEEPKKKPEEPKKKPEEPKKKPEKPKKKPEKPKKKRPLLFQKPRYRKRKRRYRKRKRRLPLIKQIDYKDTKLLNKFTSDQGKILSKRATKLHLKQQRLITLAIKKARILSFLPFTYNNKNIERIKSTLIRNAKFRNKKKYFKSKRKNRSFQNR